MTQERYEVVIRPQDGYNKEHAELVKKELLSQDWHGKAVSVRPIQEREE